MEIGTTNISALIGPYRQALATVTQKFAIPYFTTDDPSELIQRYTHFNLISVQPSLLDVYRIAVDLLVYAPSHDQRGRPRPNGPHCDIGAFEYYVAYPAFLPFVGR